MVYVDGKHTKVLCRSESQNFVAHVFDDRLAVVKYETDDSYTEDTLYGYILFETIEELKEKFWKLFAFNYFVCECKHTREQMFTFPFECGCATYTEVKDAFIADLRLG